MRTSPRACANASTGRRDTGLEPTPRRMKAGFDVPRQIQPRLNVIDEQPPPARRDGLSVGVALTLLSPTFPEAVVSKVAVFTVKLEPELRDAFMAEASHRPASQVMRELMSEFIDRQRQAREYDAFLRAKADTAPAQIASGPVARDADVEARFAARRAALRAKVGGADA